MPPDHVVITSDIRQILNNYLGEHSFSRIGILVDENTRALCLPIIHEEVADAVILEIQSGENHKNLNTCQDIWSQMTAAYFDRHALLINLGGGVIGDMGGFCAATYKRGITFINIPTTLLAQVDASVGGKLGIDFQGYKNHIGVFQKPDQVLIDPVFLHTLPQRELRSGFAEVIKHALIADGSYWPRISEYSLLEQDWKAHIKHSVRIKKQVVRQDPTERGLRKILNFGHTLGHAVESYFLNQSDGNLLHGEAIAAGMIMESYLSNRVLNMNELEVKAIQDYLLTVFGKISLSEKDINPIIDLSMQDKKNEMGNINFSLLKRIGEAAFNISVSRSQMEDALVQYLNIVLI